MRSNIGVQFGICIALLAAGVPIPANANLVQNGSLEDLNSTFSPNILGCTTYEKLGNTSTVIPGWTVATSAGDVVWAKSPTCDGPPTGPLSAADGTFFLDLSGQGNQATDGALRQALTVVDGQTYNVSIDKYTGNNGIFTLKVGSQTITLSDGVPFVVNGTSWTPETGTFVGNASELNPLLAITHGGNNGDLVFIDNINITTAAPAAAPEPGTWALLSLSLAALGVIRRRRTG